MSDGYRDGLSHEYEQASHPIRIFTCVMCLAGHEGIPCNYHRYGQAESLEQRIAALEAQLAAVTQLVPKAGPKGEALRAGSTFADGYAKAIEDATIEVGNHCACSPYDEAGRMIPLADIMQHECPIATAVRALKPPAATAAPVKCQCPPECFSAGQRAAKCHCDCHDLYEEVAHSE